MLYIQDIQAMDIQFIKVQEANNSTKAKRKNLPVLLFPPNPITPRSSPSSQPLCSRFQLDHLAAQRSSLMLSSNYYRFSLHSNLELEAAGNQTAVTSQHNTIHHTFTQSWPPLVPPTTNMCNHTSSNSYKHLPLNTQTPTQTSPTPRLRQRFTEMDIFNDFEER